MSNKLTLGADPELFFVDEKGKPVPAYTILMGDRNDPLEMGEFSYHYDNVMLEFNVPPAKTASDFVSNIMGGLSLINVFKTDKVNPAIVTSLDFDSSILKDDRALLIGCDPDMNAYTGEKNTTVEVEELGVTRMAGGHIHVGYPDPTPEFNVTFIKALDLFIGMPLSLLDVDEFRCKHYGQAGCYRDQEYGVEYRTPSNYWIRTPESVGWVYANVHAAYEFAKEWQLEVDSDEDLIRKSIGHIGHYHEELIMRYGVEEVSKSA
jgi:hypothetical protein